MATVQFKGVSKVYGSRSRAVDSVDLEIADGEFVVLVGPSGCGKSTTLRMVAGLEEISGGTIAIGDRIVNDIAPKDRNIAMVFQNYALYPHLTVRQNLAFGLERRRETRSLLRSLWDSPYRLKRREESAQIAARVEGAARTLGIEGLLERPPRELSGGQRQRVAVGRALVREPAVFLFDEPLSNLDALLRGEMRTELRILHRRLRATMIYVTHDQEEAMSLADRIVAMKDGIVQQVGSPAEVYDRPANKFVAGFIGTPAMNMIAGKLSANPNGGFQLNTPHGQFTIAPDRWDARALRALDGTPVTMGIRPDRVTIAAASANQPNFITGGIVAIERYGSTADVVVAPDGKGDSKRITARCDIEQLESRKEGDSVNVGIDPAYVHLFRSDGVTVPSPA